MSQSTSVIVLMAALLLSNLSCCSADNVHCVTPTLPGSTSCSSCPNNSVHCATLSEYAQETQLYFTSNTTMVFLPGDHILNVNISVANVSRLTMCGESSSGNVARVVCSESVGFSFSSMADFKAHYLTFTLCGRNFGGSKYKATLLLESIGNAELVNSSFHGNIGTTLMVYNTSIILVGNSEFTQGGGGITAVDSNIILIGNTTFIENDAILGSAVIDVTNCSLSSTGSIHFINNSNTGHSVYPAVAIWATTSLLNFVGTNNFINNSINISKDFGWGGAIYASNNTLLSFNGTSNFLTNSDYSDVIVVEDNTSLRFTGTCNFINNVGGAVYAFNNSSVNFNGTNNFVNNSAAYYLLESPGGAVDAENNTTLSFTGTSNFINNSASAGGAIYASSNTSLSFMGTSNFINNSAPGGSGGGVYLSASSLSILPNTTLYWQSNHAYLGGAIYVDDQSNPFIYCSSTYIKSKIDECLFQLPGQNLSNDIDVQFVFKDNSAEAAGSVLYGGAIDNCTLIGLNSYNSGDMFDMLVHIEDDNTNSRISSHPFRICPCEAQNSSCSNSDALYPVYPGETFHVSLVAVGQRNGTVPTPVIGHFRDPNIDNLQSFQYTQETKSTCTKLNYTVFPSRSGSNFNLELYADGPCSTFSDKLILQLDVNPSCPLGFNLSKRDRSCVCEQRLQEYTTHCTITDGLGKITRPSNDQFWVGYDPSHGLILHPHCPLDYCVSWSVEFPLNDTDSQCVNKRSGLLCGACKKGFSLVLGTTQCKKCTNNHLALLVPFALMGIALVFLLLICKLTVAIGTLSGVLFYANIVGVNRTLFLPVETTNTLSVFIAWLNIDFGVETCFYNGMDAYSKTWLQFVFPVYIWMIVGLLILVSRFSDKFAKLLGNNPVSVLATLILFSYTKILRTIIAAINVTYLEYPTYNKVVWLYDGNVNYLSGKHIPLFLVAMVFLLLFLSYTLLLLLGQWLQAISHVRMFAWVNKLKPFMDSYHAPYKAKHRYWPGLLLVLRFGLLLILAFNPQQDPSTNLLAILVGTGVLTIWAWISGGVYRNWCLNALESSFALNLIILAAATYHVKLSRGNRSQLAVGYTSVIIAIVTFTGILAYHIFLQVRDTKLWKMFPKHDLNSNHAVIEPVNNAKVFEDSYQLREPLLEDPPQQNYGAF